MTEQKSPGNLKYTKLPTEDKTSVSVVLKEKQSIKASRFFKESEDLKKIRDKYPNKFSDDDKVLTFEINDEKFKNITGYIELPDEYPFVQPRIKFDLNSDNFASFIYNEFSPADYYCKEPWTPSITLDQLIKQVHNFLRENVVKIQEKDTFMAFINIIENLKAEKLFFLIIILTLVLWRALVGLGPYSGYNDPPNYGDYEAQRHWMELTWGLPANEWYVEGPYNNFSQWKLDYPPLTAYHSYLIGGITTFIDPKSMELGNSRGYETQSHKWIMRTSVLLSDIFIFFTSVWALSQTTLKKYHPILRHLFCLIFLGNPLFILFDHGHFQFNCCMLGLVTWAFVFALRGKIFLTCFFFVAALSFKQMSLYYALVFFGFILGKIIKSSELLDPLSLKSKGAKWANFIVMFLYAGVSVIISFVAIWFPFLKSFKQFMQVIEAIFPVWRGIVHLCGVANFFAVTNVLALKWQNLFALPVLFKITLVLCILTSLPSLIGLILRPSKKVFSIALFTISLAWFSFSYQVHEKTVLLPLLGMCVAFQYYGIYVFDFTWYPLVGCIFLLYVIEKIEIVLPIMILFFLVGIKLHHLLKEIKFVNKRWGPYFGELESIPESTDKYQRLVYKLDYYYFRYLRKPYLIFSIIVSFLIFIGAYKIRKYECLIQIIYSYVPFCFNMLCYLRGNLMIWSEVNYGNTNVKKEKEKKKKL